MAQHAPFCNLLGTKICLTLTLIKMIKGYSRLLPDAEMTIPGPVPLTTSNFEHHRSVDLMIAVRNCANFDQQCVVTLPKCVKSYFSNSYSLADADL